MKVSHAVPRQPGSPACFLADVSGARQRGGGMGWEEVVGGGKVNGGRFGVAAGGEGGFGARDRAI